MINFCFSSLGRPGLRGGSPRRRDEELVMHFMDILKKGIVGGNTFQHGMRDGTMRGLRFTTRI